MPKAAELDVLDLKSITTFMEELSESMDRHNISLEDGMTISVFENVAGVIDCDYERGMTFRASVT